MIKYILAWLFIFIVGSLIVNFIIYPESFSKIKQNIESSLQEAKIESSENLQLEKVEPNYYETKCSLIDTTAEIYDMNPREFKRKICLMKCRDLEMSYHSYSCEENKLICNCIVQ